MENRSSEDPYNVMRECFSGRRSDSLEPLRAVLLDWTRNMPLLMSISRVVLLPRIQSLISSTEVGMLEMLFDLRRTYKGT